MDKFTKEQRDILIRYGITQEDIDNIREELLSDDTMDERLIKRQAVMERLKDRDAWNKAYKEWMKKKGIDV